MKIKRIISENLFSWENLDIEFDDLNSIISFSGRNGTGKSSLFEIIKWVLFKKSTKKNVKGDYGKTNGWGKIEFDNGFWISRETNEPKTILAPDDQIIDQDRLNDILGCSYDSFMAALMCDQERVSSFINEKTDTGKARIFGEMLGCGILDDIRKKVSKIKNEDQIAYESQNSRVDTLKEQLELNQIKFGDKSPEEYKNSISKLKTKLNQLELEYKKSQENYNNQLEIYNKWIKYESQIKLIEDVSARKERERHRLEELKSKIKLLRKDCPDLKNCKEWKSKKDNEWKNANDVVNKHTSDLHICKHNYDKVKSLIKQGGECPTCGTEITGGTRSRLEQNLSSFKNEFNSLKKIVKEFNDKKHLLEKEIAEVSENKRQLDSLVDQYNNVKDYLESGINEQEQMLEKPLGDKPDIKRLNEELNKRSETTFKYRAEIRARIATYNSFIKVRRALTGAEKEIKGLEKRSYISRWLFTNLPLIKLMYIAENKERLQNLINENLVSIALPFQVEIDTQKELKSSKEIKDSFSFRIMSLDGRKAENSDLSGGEKTLLLLAVQFAINDLISPNLEIEIYDEIYGSLDDKNIDTIIPMIRNRGERKQIFTISHKKEISSAFDDEVEIRKGDNGSFYLRS